MKGLRQWWAKLVCNIYKDGMYVNSGQSWYVTYIKLVCNMYKVGMYVNGGQSWYVTYIKLVCMLMVDKIGM